MSLIKCRECGNEVSSKAETCPKCGARVASKPMGCGTLIGVIFLGAIIISVFSGIFSSKSSTSSIGTITSTTPEDEKVRARAARVAECKQQVAAQRLEYDKLLAASKFWFAANEIRSCSVVLDDADLKRLVAQAESKDRWATLQDLKQPAWTRAKALEALERDFPEEAKDQAAKLGPLRTQIERAVKEQERKEAAATAARRRKEGVSLGMTQEEVMQSSWGRPNKINRTVHSWGTKEQWVYNGGYLYFTDGVLDAIQH